MTPTQHWPTQSPAPETFGASGLGEQPTDSRGTRIRHRIFGFTAFTAVIGLILAAAERGPTVVPKNVEAAQRISSQNASGVVTPARMRPVELAGTEKSSPQAVSDSLQVARTISDVKKVAPAHKQILMPPTTLNSVEEINTNLPPTVIVDGSVKDNSLSTAHFSIPHSVQPGQKFVLQVAALASDEKATKLRWKLKGVGFTSFTQKATTPDGELIRVRIGPFSTKSEIDAANLKLAAVGLSGAITQDAQEVNSPSR